ncbi:UNVERIFIED_CONTAM: hypothetical protein FKN15_045369 [Acipenser sinensis]
MLPFFLMAWVLGLTHAHATAHGRLQDEAAANSMSGTGNLSLPTDLAIPYAEDLFSKPDYFSTNRKGELSELAGYSADQQWQSHDHVFVATEFDAANDGLFDFSQHYRYDEDALEQHSFSSQDSDDINSHLTKYVVPFVANENPMASESEGDVEHALFTNLSNDPDVDFPEVIAYADLVTSPKENVSITLVTEMGIGELGNEESDSDNYTSGTYSETLGYDFALFLDLEKEGNDSLPPEDVVNGDLAGMHASFDCSVLTDINQEWYEVLSPAFKITSARNFPNLSGGHMLPGSIFDASIGPYGVFNLPIKNPGIPSHHSTVAPADKSTREGGPTTLVPATTCGVADMTIKLIGGRLTDIKVRVAIILVEVSKIARRCRYTVLEKKGVVIFTTAFKGCNVKARDRNYILTLLYTTTAGKRGYVHMKCPTMAPTATNTKLTKTTRTSAGESNRRARRNARDETKTMRCLCGDATKTTRSGSGDATKTTRRGSGDATRTTRRGSGDATRTTRRGSGDATRTTRRGSGDATKTTRRGSGDATRMTRRGSGDATRMTRRGSGDATRTTRRGSGDATRTTRRGSGDATRTTRRGSGDATRTTRRGSGDATRTTRRGSGDATRTTRRGSGDATRTTRRGSGDATRTTRRGSGDATRTTRRGSGDATRTTRRGSGDATRTTRRGSGDATRTTRRGSGDATRTTRRGSGDATRTTRRGSGNVTKTTRRGSGDATKTTRTPWNATRTTRRGSGDATRTTHRGSGDATRTTRRGSGDATRTTRRGSGDATRTTRRGSGHATRTTRRGSGDVTKTTRRGSGDATRTTRRGSGDATRTTRRGSGDATRTTRRGSGDATRTTRRGSGDGSGDVTRTTRSPGNATRTTRRGSGDVTRTTRSPGNATRTTRRGSGDATRTTRRGSGDATRTTRSPGNATRTTRRGSGDATRTTRRGSGHATRTTRRGSGDATRTTRRGSGNATKTTRRGSGDATKTTRRGSGDATKTTRTPWNATRTTRRGSGDATRTTRRGSGDATKTTRTITRKTTEKTETSAGEVTKAPTSVVCRASSMVLELPKEPLKRVLFLDKSNQWVAVIDAPEYCNYTLSQGIRRNYFITPYTACDVRILNKNYVLKLWYLTTGGEKGNVLMKCPTSAGEPTEAPTPTTTTRKPTEPVSIATTICRASTMMVVLPPGPLKEVLLIDKSNQWVAVIDAPEYCNYTLSQGIGRNFFITPYTACDVRILNKNYVLKLWYLTTGGEKGNVLMKCPTSAGEPTEAPTPTTTTRKPTEPVSIATTICRASTMMVVLPPGPLEEVLVMDKSNNLVPVKYAPKYCNYSLVEGEGRNIFITPYITTCDVQILNNSYVLTLHYTTTEGVFVSVGMKCPTSAGEPTEAPTPTATTRKPTEPVPIATTICRASTMMVVLPPGPLKEVLLIDQSNNLVPVNDAPKYCNYSLVEGEGRNIFITPYTTCDVKILNKNYVLTLHYTTTEGVFGYVGMKCPTSAALPTISPLPPFGVSVLCSDTCMTVELPGGLLEDIQLMDESNNLVAVTSAPKTCGYSLVRGNGKNILTAPYNACNVKILNNFYILRVLYTTLTGQHGDIHAKCPVPGLVPREACTADGHFVFVVYRTSTKPEIDPGSLVIAGKQSCAPVICTPDFAIFKFPVTGCGTHVFMVAETTIYLAEVHGLVRGTGQMYGEITRDSSYRLQVECRYSKGSLASSGYLVVNPPPPSAALAFGSLGVSFQVECRYSKGHLASTGYLVVNPPPPSAALAFGSLGVRLRIATDTSYTSFYPQSHLPLSFLLGSKVYLEVQLVNPPDPNVVLLVHYCIAYPQSSQAAWVILYEGFCLKCIQDHLKHKAAADKYSCPECHAEFEVKPRLVKNGELSDKVQQHARCQENGIICDYCLEEESPAVMSCLQCEAFFCMTHLRPHSEKVYLKDHVLVEPAEAMSLRKCPEHKEILKLFCRDHGTCICMLCCIVGQHKQHPVCTIEEAKKEAEDAYSAFHEKAVHHYKQIKALIEEDELQALQFIESERQVAISHIESQTKEQVEELDDVERTIQQIHTLLNQTDTVRFLKDATTVTLDPGTANENLILSENRTIVRYTDEPVKSPYNPKRFDDTLYVLGCEGFNFGRHYWEVVVKSKTDWEIGVAYSSLPRKGKTWLGRNNISWSLDCSGGQCTGWHNNRSIKLNMKSNLERVGVYLDYTGGMLSFYDAEKMTLLLSFYSKFTEAVHPVLNPCNSKGGNFAPLIVL